MTHAPLTPADAEGELLRAYRQVVDAQMADFLARYLRALRLDLEHALLVGHAEGFAQAQEMLDEALQDARTRVAQAAQPAGAPAQA